MRALDSTSMAYCLPTFTSVSIEYQLPMLLPALPTLRSPISSMSFLSLLWVSRGAFAVASAVSLGDGLAGSFAACDGSGEATEGWGEDCVLSCANAGIARPTLSSTAMTTAQAGDFMGNSSADPHLARVLSAHIICFESKPSVMDFRNPAARQTFLRGAIGLELPLAAQALRNLV